MKPLIPAMLALSLIGCASPQSREPLDATTLAAAREPLLCQGEPQCRTYWQRAQVWIATNSRWKMQMATDSVIATYTPIRGSTDPGFQVTRSPVGSEQDEIRITLRCDNFIYGCQPEKEIAEASFKSYVRQRN